MDILCPKRRAFGTSTTFWTNLSKGFQFKQNPYDLTGLIFVLLLWFVPRKSQSWGPENPCKINVVQLISLSLGSTL